MTKNYAVIREFHLGGNDRITIIVKKEHYNPNIDHEILLETDNYEEAVNYVIKKINFMKEYINIDKCSTFESMMLYLMATMKEDDLRKDIIEEGWTPIGEIERYCRFGIDFSVGESNEWTNMCGLEDKDSLWELENQFQKVAVEAAKLYDEIQKHEYKLKLLK